MNSQIIPNAGIPGLENPGSTQVNNELPSPLQSGGGAGITGATLDALPTPQNFQQPSNSGLTELPRPTELEHLRETVAAQAGGLPVPELLEQLQAKASKANPEGRDEG